MNNNKLYSMIRMQTAADNKQLLDRIKHNYRYYKEDRIKNNDGYYCPTNGKIKQLKTREEQLSVYKEKYLKLKNIWEESSNDMMELYKEHTTKEGKTKYHNKKRIRPIGEGIIGFSKGINEDFIKNRKGFINKLQNFIKDFENKYNTEVLDWAIHADEVDKGKNYNEDIGNIHIQFFYKNYDKTNGIPLKFEKTQEGANLQDLISNQYKDFGKGYQRGEKNSKKRYLSIEEYKKQQDLKKTMNKEVEQLKKENTELQAKKYNLKRDNQFLKEEIKKEEEKHNKTILKMKSENKIIETEYEEKKYLLLEKQAEINLTLQNLKNDIQPEIDNLKILFKEIEEITQIPPNRKTQKMEKLISKLDYFIKKEKWDKFHINIEELQKVLDDVINTTIKNPNINKIK